MISVDQYVQPFNVGFTTIPLVRALYMCIDAETEMGF